MHEIEPFWKWRDIYTTERDKRSPLYGVEHSEFEYSQAVYNYIIHPQWDQFGSNTLYLKILYADYRNQFAIIEFIGEWNDCIGNDVMFLKREIIDVMLKEGINKFVLIGENVINFHSSDNSYYEEWNDDVVNEGGWIIALNFREHVVREMMSSDIHYYMILTENFSEFPWRKFKPRHLVQVLDNILMKKIS